MNILLMMIGGEGTMKESEQEFSSVGIKKLLKDFCIVRSYFLSVVQKWSVVRMVKEKVEYIL